MAICKEEKEHEISRFTTGEARTMSDIMKFVDREEFRKWLSEHCLSNDGVWLLFGKAGGPKTIKSAFPLYSKNMSLPELILRLCPYL